jgi:hypothetical protein
VTAIELLFSEPFSTKVQTRSVSTVADVEELAGELLTRYQSAGDILPGIELRRDGGESLSIAVAPFGWALVHTDAEFAQHCTRCQGAEDGGGHDVRWEEPDSVPHGWFIPQHEAVAGVGQWMNDGSLASQLSWSDQCL